ncbi:hypothetical protein Nepgr_001309 [Nepenthes gracilis]|uniref:Uncharacterized protein n=1 Tax=Nepenthes gracilis TaxID=150966 RepID=A0AAD3P5T6_NEPGR|nr:hypothetical protein Nepgr_001309 [Nepenthes gracilis]
MLCQQPTPTCQFRYPYQATYLISSIPIGRRFLFLQIHEEEKEFDDQESVACFSCSEILMNVTAECRFLCDIHGLLIFWDPRFSRKARSCLGFMQLSAAMAMT